MTLEISISMILAFTILEAFMRVKLEWLNELVDLSGLTEEIVEN